MPVVPVSNRNSVGLAETTDAKLRPADYGATGNGIGQAVSQFGKQIGEFADERERQQSVFDENTVRDASNRMDEARRTLLESGDSPYLHTKGRIALSDRPAAEAALKAKRDELAGNFKGGRAKRLWEQTGERIYSLGVSQVGQHASRANQEYTAETSAGQIEQSTRSAISSTDPEARDAFIATTINVIAEQGHRDGKPPEKIALDQQKAVSKIFASVVEFTPDASGAQAAFSQFKGEMTPEDRLRVGDRVKADVRRAAAEARAVAAHARSLALEQLATVKARLDTGAGTSADWEQLAAGYTAAGDTSAAAEAHAHGVEMKASDAHRGSTLPHIDQRISALQAKPSLGVDEASELRGLQRRRDTTAQRLDQSGGALAQYQFATGNAVDPIDPRDPDSYRARARRAIEAARTYGRRTVEPLTQADAQPLKDLVAGDPSSRLQALTTIAKFGDPRAIDGAARQISAQGDGSFRIAATLITLPGDAGYQAARDILRGPEAAKTNANVFLPAQSKFIFTSHAMAALRGLPPDYAADVRDAAQNIYFARMTAAGRTQWDNQAWRDSIDTALGSYRQNGIKYGGVTTFRGVPVSLPPGWTGDGVFRRLARASGPEWAAAAVSKAPVWPDGSAAYTGQLRQLTPVRVGGTRYAFMTRNNRFLGAKGGGAYVIDVAKVPWK